MKTMKAFLVLITLTLPFTPVAVAFDRMSDHPSSHTVEKYLSNIQDRVRQCSILPFVYDAHRMRKEHAFQSHCPEVKLLPVSGAHAMAKIRVAGHQFIARLIETDFSDGDFYDVEIRNLNTQETYRFDNVLAYGDVLRGVLGGETKGVTSTFVVE
jgi:hypothetical protein